MKARHAARCAPKTPELHTDIQTCYSLDNTILQVADRAYFQSFVLAFYFTLFMWAYINIIHNISKENYYYYWLAA